MAALATPLRQQPPIVNHQKHHHTAPYHASPPLHSSDHPAFTCHLHSRCHSAAKDYSYFNPYGPRHLSRSICESSATKLPGVTGGGGIDNLLEESQVTVEDLYRLEVQQQVCSNAAVSARSTATTATRGWGRSSPAAVPFNREVRSSTHSRSELSEIHHLMRFR